MKIGKILGTGLRGFLWALAFWGVFVLVPWAVGIVAILAAIRGGKFEAFRLDWWDVVSLFVFCFGVACYLWDWHRMRNFYKAHEPTEKRHYGENKLSVAMWEDDGGTYDINFVKRLKEMTDDELAAYLKDHPPATVGDIERLLNQLRLKDAPKSVGEIFRRKEELEKEIAKRARAHERGKAVQGRGGENSSPTVELPLN